MDSPGVSFPREIRELDPDPGLLGTNHDVNHQKITRNSSRCETETPVDSENSPESM